MKMVGLFHCKDTLVGDAMVRGISGGEKKRLTTSEMLVGPRNVLLLDEISTGLDSATLFVIIKWLSQARKMESFNIDSFIGVCFIFWRSKEATFEARHPVELISLVLLQAAHAFKSTCLISLLQPPPETFQLFDDVMMISDGLIIYHGEGWRRCARHDE